MIINIPMQNIVSLTAFYLSTWQQTMSEMPEMLKKKLAEGGSKTVTMMFENGNLQLFGSEAIINAKSQKVMGATYISDVVFIS